MRRLLALPAIALLLCGSAQAQQPFAFEFLDGDLPALNFGRVAILDVDGDGQLDLYGSGNSQTEPPYIPSAFLARSAGSPLSQVTTIPGARWLSVPLVNDLDGDGRPDIALIGASDAALPDGNPWQSASSGALLASGESLQEGSVRTTALAAASGDWADIDLDGDQDLVVVGLDQNGDPTTRVVVRVSPGTYEERSHNLPALAQGDAKFADVDGDGDPDLALSGMNARGGFQGMLLLNDGAGNFSLHQNLASLAYGSFTWGDYDGDGDADLVMTGGQLDLRVQIQGQTILYRNDGGTLVPSGIALPGLFYGSASWGDADQDGDPDLLLTGIPRLTGGRIGIMLAYEDGAYRRLAAFPGTFTGNAQWADFDGDLDLDLVVTGSDIRLAPSTRVLMNGNRRVNTAPAPPQALADVPDPISGIRLTWEAGSDAETAAPWLSYAVRIGSAPGLSDIRSAMADPASGTRWVSQAGNAGSNQFLRIEGLPSGTYYWSVQTVDAGLVGSGFATEQSFTVASGVVTSTEDSAVPSVFDVGAPYPNPAQGTVRIQVDLPRAATLSMTVFDVQGREVARPVAHAPRPAGSHALTWTPDRVPPGVYFLHLQVDGTRRTLPVTIVR